MTLRNREKEVQHTRNLLQQHRRNLQYLQQQVAQYGQDAPLPVAIHNAIKAEQKIIANLERELTQWGESLEQAPQWQAVVIDPDPHWREIIINNIAQLGGTAVEQDNINNTRKDELLVHCQLGVIGISAKNDPTSQKYAALATENILNLAQQLPLILLVDWDKRETAIVLRQVAREYNIEAPPVTIFKDNFDPSWFSRVVHKILTR